PGPGHVRLRLAAEPAGGRLPADHRRRPRARQRPCARRARRRPVRDGAACLRAGRNGRTVTVHDGTVDSAPLRVGTQAGLTAALVLVVVCVGVVSSLGAPLIPAIAASRNVSPAAAQWSLTVTLLTGAVAAPILGRLGDGPGRREVILATLA